MLLFQAQKNVRKCETIDFLCGSPIHPKLQVDGEENKPYLLKLPPSTIANRLN
jgi:hypothetical protein